MTKILSLDIDIFGLKIMMKSGPHFFILKKQAPLELLLPSTKKNLSRKAELAGQVSRCFWRGTLNWHFFLLICYGKEVQEKIIIKLLRSKTAAAKERSSFLTRQCRPRAGIGLLGLILRKFSRLYFVEICTSLLAIDLWNNVKVCWKRISWCRQTILGTIKIIGLVR